jgi:Fur family transcriptional regulator, ferric uptake regulator
MILNSNNKRRIKQTSGNRLFSTAGRRVTSQRILLLDLIRKSEGHIDAEALHRLARERHPRLSLSTVYRTLQLFKSLGLVDEHHFGESRHHYEVRDNTEHHHLVCLGCGAIVEFQCPLTEEIKKDIGKENDFQIINTEVRMLGLCADCRAKKE